MPISMMPLLASILLAPAPGPAVHSEPGGQLTQACQTATPQSEVLAAAIGRGDVLALQNALDQGLDANETWRDLPAQICQSLLFRSVRHSQDEMFHLLVKRGADPRRLPREALTAAVQNGQVDLVRTLLALDMTPADNNAIVREALNSKSVQILDLLASSGVQITAGTVPAWALTDALTVHLVPKYIRPNDFTGIGNSSCSVQELFGLLSPQQDGCEGTGGPLWFHFVLTGNLRMMELMIKHGADLSMASKVWDNSSSRSFNAMDVAVRRKDTSMVSLLRRAGAPSGIWKPKPP